MFSKIVKDIFLGDHTITILEDRHKEQYAQLNNSFGSKIEFRVSKDTIDFRVINGGVNNVSWVTVPLQYFAIIINELGASESIIEAINEQSK